MYQQQPQQQQLPPGFAPPGFGGPPPGTYAAAPPPGTFGVAPPPGFVPPYVAPPPGAFAPPPGPSSAQLPPPGTVHAPPAVAQPPPPGVAQVQLLQAQQEAAFGRVASDAHALEDESDWLSSHPLHFTLRVVTPVQEGKGWALDGATLELQVRLDQTVEAVKAQVQDMTGLPAKAAKLKHHGSVLKDARSLAACNLTQGDVLELDVVRRGGKK